MTSKERIEGALAGRDVDRPPFTFWYHFHLQKFPGERHAQATLDFHRKFGTDLVKVMSDFPYPAKSLRGLKPEENPFPEQVRALEIIRDGLGGTVDFIETIFNPYNQARKIASWDELRRMIDEEPQALLDALEAIAKSEAAHAKRSVAAGAAGVFLAIDNHPRLTAEEYARFSEPFDRMVLDAVRDARLNVIHLHGDRIYIDRFYRGWPVAALHYSIHTTGIPFIEARRNYDGVLMGGVDEVHFRTLTVDRIREQWRAARAAAGPRYLLAPGCSVPDESPEEEMSRLPAALA